MATQEKVGKAFLDKELFSNYIFNAPGAAGQQSDLPSFQISLENLLETLQIFGVHDTKDRWSGRDPSYGGVTESMARGGPAAAFDNRVLGMSGVCRLGYAAEGAPLTVTMEETGVTTVCELSTYAPEPVADIPLRKDAIVQKIIMRAGWLHDAIAELSATAPTRLTMVAAPTSPYFSLSANGPHGSATVEFNRDPQLLETFQVARRVVNTYRYSLIKGAGRAMGMATKVSIRADDQGVLSLQFMIEVEGGNVSFVDFSFAPQLPEDEDDDQDVGEDLNDGFD